MDNLKLYCPKCKECQYESIATYTPPQKVINIIKENSRCMVCHVRLVEKGITGQDGL